MRVSTAIGNELSLFKGILAGHSDGILVVSMQGEILYANAIGSKLLNPCFNNVVGTNLCDHLSSDKTSRFLNVLQQIAGIQEKVDFEEYFESIGALMKVQIYRVDGVACLLFNDITKERRLEEQVVKDKQQEKCSYIRAIIAAQEKERQEIGAELHDNINQILTATTLYLEMVEHSETFRKDWIRQAHQQVQTVIQEIRLFSRGLAIPVLPKFGLIESLQDLLYPYMMSNSFQIVQECDDTVNTLSPDIQLALYRMVQSQLNNIVKYAEASKIVLQLKMNDTVTLLIKDDGIGFKPAQKSKGMGLNNIINRAEAYNGSVCIDSVPGGGCAVEVKIPIQ